MRTTLTLDDDVAAKLKAEARRSGRSFKETVNSMLRLALNRRRDVRPAKRFVVRPSVMGLKPGLSYDRISEVLDLIEGEDRR